jgi:hypothetical protein
MIFSSWLRGTTHGSKRHLKRGRPTTSRSRHPSLQCAMERLEDRRLLSAVIDFAAVQMYSSGGSHPQCLTAGDFNGDGISDLAVANNSTNDLTVYLGNASGGLTPAGTFLTGGTGPTSMTVGHFDGDGHLDLAVTHSASKNVSILRGNGLGGFLPAIMSATGVASSPFSVAAADFNGDGNADLVVGNLFQSTAGVLLGNGEGSFAAPMDFATGGSQLRSLAVGDFNGDGEVDVVAAHSGSADVGILLGNGAGALTLAGTFSGGGVNTQSIAVGDFNGDNKLDIVVANGGGSGTGSNTAGVLLGNGNGGFGPATTYAAAPGAVAAAVGDFNNDGNLDFVVASFLNPSRVSVFQGNGSGTFAAASYFSAGSTASSVVVADFNGDGRADIAAANNGHNNVGVLLNTTIINQAPVNTVPGDQIAAEDVALVISGLSVSDDDLAGILTVQFGVVHGTLTVNDNVGGGVVIGGISGNGTANLMLTGTQVQINATLAAATGLTYLGNKDFSGLDILTMTTTDSGNLSDTDAITIEVLSSTQQVELLAAAIADLADDGVLNGGQAGALIKMLNQTNIHGFTYYVGALVRMNKLTLEQGEELIEAAESILASQA